jgi:drug/metabolite transporter (DMT)-like permease
MGISAFCYAPLIGLAGLKKTGAVDNAILIALEPMVTVALAAIFLAERLDRVQVLSFVISLLGFSFLSGLATQPMGTWATDPSILGNLILVVSLLGEGGYSIFARKLSDRYATLSVFGSALMSGFVILTLAATLAGGLPDLTRLGSHEWLALLWLGPIGSTLTYLYWLVALESTDVSSAALTLFVQPVVGSILGVWIFQESLGLTKGFGAFMIFCAVGLLTAHRPVREAKTTELK